MKKITRKYAREIAKEIAKEIVSAIKSDSTVYNRDIYDNAKEGQEYDFESRNLQY